MTYKELADFVNTLTTDQLRLDVSIYSNSEDEYTELVDTDFNVESDVLDSDHPVLITN